MMVCGIERLADFTALIITSEFNTPFIRVGRGVLQGYCLSPLLFNMCFNTFFQHIKDGRLHENRRRPMKTMINLWIDASTHTNVQ